MNIPSKTFFLGEYAALCGSPAILWTTPPYFEIRLLSTKTLVGIHPDAPAAQFWHDRACQTGLYFQDPYQGLGGLGASSAQFIAVYQLFCHEKRKPVLRSELLEAYFTFAWHQQGMKPSGYDILAQTQLGWCYINHDYHLQSLQWPFESLVPVLIHTQQKCLTHTYLQHIQSLPDLSVLHTFVQQAYQAFQTIQTDMLIDAVNAYYHIMLSYQWVAPYTQTLISQLRHITGVLALKGCGAMGSEVILVLLDKCQAMQFIQHCDQQALRVIVPSNTLLTHLRQELH